MADEFVVKNGVIVKSGTLTVGDPSTTGYALPSTDGTSGQALVTDGAGGVAFQTVSGGSGSFTLERFRAVYNSFGQVASIDNETSGIDSTTIVGGTNVDVAFVGYSYPPVSIMTYGYNNTSDVYLINHVNSGFGTRQIDGNGGAIFGSLSTSENLRLSLTTGNTGASNSQHAWTVFVFAG